MEEQTSFDIEDAEALLKQLQEFDQTLQQEWSKVLSQWGNLKINWQDAQFGKFEPLFEKLAGNYNAAKFESEVYIGYLEKQIEIAKKQRFNLFKALEKPITIAQAVISLGGINASPPTQTAGLVQQSSSSYVQQKDHSSCSVDEKLDLEKSPAVQQYNSLPGIARVMSTEEQLNEAYAQEQERKTKRRKKKAEDSAKAASFPTASGSPTPISDSAKVNSALETNLNGSTQLTNATYTNSVIEFAQSLNYQVRYGSFAVGDSGRIEAVGPDGNYADCFINFEVSQLGRIRIKDTLVAPNYQGKGVGTKLVKALESKVPNGTVLYFYENQAPGFWEKMGFKPIINNGVTEYCKKVHKLDNSK